MSEQIMCRAPGCGKPKYHQRKDLCEHHYWCLRTYGSFDVPPKDRKPDSERCAVDGCAKPPRSRVATYCEKHYGQIRRNGYLGPIERPDLIEQSAGYMLLKAPKHRLATPGQQYRIYEHRAEFYATFGEGPFHCVGCGGELAWEAACICRQNSDRADNEVDNLEIRCRSCASKKGFEYAKEWMEDHHYRWMEWNGKRQTATDWAKELGLRPTTVLRRLNAGWSVQKILTTKRGGTRNLPRPWSQKLTDTQVHEIRELINTSSHEEIASRYGLGASTISRIANGHRRDSALTAPPPRDPHKRSKAQAFVQRLLSEQHGSQCIIWPFYKHGGRAVFNYGSGPIGVGRYICERLHPADRKPKSRAIAICTTNGCVNPSHWAWGTPKDIEDKKRRAGNDNVGENNGRAKLTNEQAAEIKALLQDNTQAEIAKAYNVSRATVSRIQHGTHWRNA